MVNSALRLKLLATLGIVKPLHKEFHYSKTQPLTNLFIRFTSKLCREYPVIGTVARKQFQTIDFIADVNLCISIFHTTAPPNFSIKFCKAAQVLERISRHPQCFRIYIATCTHISSIGRYSADFVVDEPLFEKMLSHLCLNSKTKKNSNYFTAASIGSNMDG